MSEEVTIKVYYMSYTGFTAKKIMFKTNIKGYLSSESQLSQFCLNYQKMVILNIIFCRVTEYNVDLVFLLSLSY